VKQDEPIYICGYAQPVASENWKPKKKDMKTLIKARKTILESPELTRKFDTDGDGVLNIHEMERGMRVLANRMQLENPDKKSFDTKKVKMIFRATSSSPLVISNFEMDYNAMYTKMSRIMFVTGLVGFMISIGGGYWGLVLNEPIIFYSLFGMFFIFSHFAPKGK